MKGIDTLDCYGSINYDSIKADGYDYAILRIRTEYGKDPTFEENYYRARTAGLAIGACWRSTALTPAEARAEAVMCCEMIQGHQFDFPVYYTISGRKQMSTGRDNISEMIDAFCSTLEQNRIFTGIHLSKDQLDHFVNDDITNKYHIYVAEYADDCHYGGPYGMWKNDTYSEHPGMGVSVCDVNYPAIIRTKGMSGRIAAPRRGAETDGVYYRVILGKRYTDRDDALGDLLEAQAYCDNSAKLVKSVNMDSRQFCYVIAVGRYDKRKTADDALSKVRRYYDRDARIMKDYGREG